MISSFIYLYGVVLGLLGTLLDILIPFPVPDVLLSVPSILSSFWYYGLSIIPITTITISKALFYSISFLITLKILDLMRLPFTWFESRFTHTPLPHSGHSSSLPSKK